jgi:hypothetical protein
MKMIDFFLSPVAGELDWETDGTGQKGGRGSQSRMFGRFELLE